MGRLEGKRALVTGASSGIGREVANRFAHEGAVVAIGGRDPERMQQTVDEITASGGTAIAALGDVSQAAGAQSVVAAAADGLGGLDTLVNNAGIFRWFRSESVPVPSTVTVARASYNCSLQLDVRGA